MSEERTTLRTTLHHGILGALRGSSTAPVGPSQTTVTAILLLAGLPRLLTGSILAHEVMHAFFRLAGYRDLPSEVEEGTCQLMALLWLEHQNTSEVCEIVPRCVFCIRVAWLAVGFNVFIYVVAGYEILLQHPHVGTHLPSSLRHVACEAFEHHVDVS